MLETYKTECIKSLNSFGRSNYVGLLPIVLLYGLTTCLLEPSESAAKNTKRLGQTWRWDYALMRATVMYTLPHILHSVQKSEVTWCLKVPAYIAIGVGAAYGIFCNARNFFKAPAVLRGKKRSTHIYSSKSRWVNADDYLVTTLLYNSIPLGLGVFAARTSANTLQFTESLSPLIPTILFFGLISTEILRASDRQSAPQKNEQKSTMLIIRLAASIAAFCGAAYAGFRLQHIQTSTKCAVALGMFCCTALASCSSLYIERQELQCILKDKDATAVLKEVCTRFVASPAIITSIFMTYAFGVAPGLLDAASFSFSKSSSA